MPGVTPRSVAGKIGRISIDGTFFNFSEWTIDPSGDYLDDTGFEDKGDYGLIGIVGGTVTFGGRFRPSQNPFDKSNTITAMSGIRIGAVLPLLLVTMSGYQFAVSVLITGTPVDDKVRDAANFKATGRIQGLITYPADTIPDPGGEP